ncbi:Serine/threonine-protein kinase Nek2 [Toensbergia leucococca]|nr:Serine/threonine-protein kinase Nek2 [Toensbergia leucococca]
MTVSISTYFQRIRSIGEGGQGKCYLVRRKEDNKLLVLKIIKRRGGLGVRTPVTEVRVHALLPQHHRIVELFGVKSSLTASYVFYEHCDAGDLFEVMVKFGKKKTYIPEAFIWHIFVQLAEALAYIHHGRLGSLRRSSRNNLSWPVITHRDIKPENIFLKFPRGYDCNDNPYPDVKLGDFGMAMVSPQDDYKAFDLCGTPEWQGPEVPFCSPKGDVWSLGAIVYALAHGKPPISSMPRNWKNTQKNLDIWNCRAEARFPLPLTSEYSNGLSRWILRVLHKDPVERMSSLDVVEEMAPFGRLERRKMMLPLQRWVFRNQEILNCHQFLGGRNASL